METYTLRLERKAAGAHLHGATPGQEHRKELLGDLLASNTLAAGDGALVVIDFSAIVSVTASYLKAVFFSFVRAGVRFVDEGVPSELPPLNIFPVATGASEEIAEELIETARSTELPCLEAFRVEGGEIPAARLLGSPDPSIVETLFALADAGSATAAQLKEMHPQKTMTVNGWNNRLADLYRLRLAARQRVGRQFLYSPIARQVLRG